jgi:murein DD-endopeptidase MepM/ murein hydrolase activator NlpD
MADHARLAAAGLFLALTLAAVPALLPINLAGTDASPRAEAAAPVAPLVRLRAGNLTTPTPSTLAAEDPTVAPEGVLHFAIAEAAPLSHTVEAGETLWKISQDAGIGVEALAAANHLTVGSLLHPGRVLVIPPVDPSSATAAVPVLTHEVAAGESLWGIARASGLRVETLASANHLSLDAVLHPGQALVIPSQDGPVSAGARQARFRSPAIPAGGPKLTFQNAPLLGDTWPMAQPSEGMITSPFGWRIHPIFGTREFHTGLDIANRAGTPVRAAESGMVRFVGWMGGYGRLVVVTHANGLETSYSHLSAMLVALGQRVARGQVLGRMGSTGWSTGPHLFFEVRRNGMAVDPTPFLQGVRVAGAAPAAPPAPSTRHSRAAAPDSAVAGSPAVSTQASAVAPAVSESPSAPVAVASSEEHRTVTDSLPSPSSTP